MNLNTKVLRVICGHCLRDTTVKLEPTDPNERIFRFADGNINTATLDALADDTEVSLQLPIHSTGSSERVVNVWHRRTAFEARDFVQTTDAGLVTVKDPGCW